MTLKDFQKLNYDTFSFRLKNKGETVTIFDEIRKNFFVLTPEEWVRQHTIQYLIQTKSYPKSLINIEKEILINDLKKRYDIIVFKPDNSIFLLVECKAPKISITQHTFDQIARYNLKLKAEYLMVTNGLKHYFCQMDFKKEHYVFLKELPNFSK